MSRGILLYANNNAKCDYLKQAYALALSIKIKNANEKIALATSADVSYDVFDKIIKIQHNDNLTMLHPENRTQFYDISPYDETIVMDVDMLVASDLENYWKFLNKFDLYFTSNAFTYRNKVVKNNFYRKTFVLNKLPNVYNAFYYFKKTKENWQFFNLQNEIIKYWKDYYKRYTPKRTQQWPSMDVTSAIALKVLGLEDYAVHNQDTIPVVHLKPKIQGFVNPPKLCSDIFNTYVDQKGDIYVANFKQHGIVHYVEPQMLTENNINMLEKIYKEQN